MKNTLKIFGLITLICFSFFYTDKVITVVSEQDPLMIQINNLSESYKIIPTESIVTSDTIIPGVNGREVNIEKSYKKMKKSNVFNSNLLVYDTLYSTEKLSDNLDKYIIKGNDSKKEVSVLFIIKNDNNVDRIINILKDKKIVANLFIDYKYLIDNINKIRNYSNNNIYSFQNEYSYDTLIVSNNIIRRISNNDPKFCLSTQKNKNNLNVCSFSEMNTIIPNVNGNINNIKNNLENGSIILFDTDISIVNELSYIIDFILGKGYVIVSLDKLLD